MQFSRRNLLRAALEVPADKTGIRWVHENTLSDSRELPEIMGPGSAFIDFDNDGWMEHYPARGLSGIIK